MADVPMVETFMHETGIRLMSWIGMQVNDVGDALTLPRHSEKTVQVHGVFGVDGKCTIEGSLHEADPEAWATLNDPQANALDITAAKIETIMENVLLVRPHVTDGDETTLLDVHLLIKM